MCSLLLEKWNLPEVVCRTVSYQRYPEFSLPRYVPQDIQANVAILCIAHICFMIFEDPVEEERSIAFLRDYQDLIKWGNHSMEKITYEILFPALLKKFPTFPSSFRQFLTKAMETAESKKVLNIKNLKENAPKVSSFSKAQDQNHEAVEM